MTRAQIADPDLVAKLRAGTPERIRPCTRCNQTCQVRDVRNPLVTCIGEPTSGPRDRGPRLVRPGASRGSSVVGGGPAGLETARVAAAAGPSRHARRADGRLGGLAAVAGPNGPLVDVAGRRGRPARRRRAHSGRRTVPDRCRRVVQCTGSVAGSRRTTSPTDAVVLDVADVAARRGRRCRTRATSSCSTRSAGRSGSPSPRSSAAAAVLVTQDHIAGNELARTGDLAPANVRLAQAGVRIERRTLLRSRPARRGRGRGPVHRASTAAPSRAPPSSTAASACPTTRSPRRRRPGRRLRRPAHRPRGDPRGPPAASPL